MQKVEANLHKNLLYITLAGHFEAGEVLEAEEAVRREIKLLRPSFDLISDVRLFRPTDTEGLKGLKRIGALLKAQGMGRCVRVTQIALSALQMERVSEEAGYEPIHVFSLEEAEKILGVRLGNAPEPLPRWEALRQHRRASVGPDHTVSFTMGGSEFSSVRITNLSALGCFAVRERGWDLAFYEGAFLHDFRLDHPDLPTTPVSAKIVRFVENLTEISEDDVGLGIQFLSPPPSFVQWVDAYVGALFLPVP